MRVVDEMGVRDLVGELFEVRRQANTDTTAPYMAALSARPAGAASPGGRRGGLPDAAGLADGFDRYRPALAERGLVDFDEQIYRAIEILLADPAARAAAQARCRRMLVDEFQDLTPAHLLLIRLLVAPGYDCFGVGDDDQVIYGYSGATPEFLIDFADYFPGAADHPLEVNYRCPPAVVGRRPSPARPTTASGWPRPSGAPRAGPTRRPPRAAGRSRRGGDRTARRRPGRPAVDVIDAWRSDGVDPGRHRGAGPGQLRPTAGPGRLPRVGRSLHHPARPPRCWPGPGIRTAFAYLRIGSDPVPSVGRTSATPSAGPPGASPRWWST